MDPNISLTKTRKQLNQPLKGIVIDNKDPMNLRRVKVKVEGVLEGEDNDAFPWASPASGQGTGRRANNGSFNVPKLFSTVLVSFPNGDIYTPEYSDYTDDVTDGQVHKLYGTNYPQEKGTVNENGSWNRTNDKEGWTEDLHQSNRYIKTDDSGVVHIYIPSHCVVHIGGQLNLQVDDVLSILGKSNIGITSEREFGLDVLKTIGIQSLDDEVSLEAKHIHLNDGITYETAKNSKTLVDKSVETVTKRVSTLEKLKDTIKQKGQAAVESIKEYVGALKGTKS